MARKIISQSISKDDIERSMETYYQLHEKIRGYLREEFEAYMASFGADGSAMSDDALAVVMKHRIIEEKPRSANIRIAEPRYEIAKDEYEYKRRTKMMLYKKNRDELNRAKRILDRMMSGVESRHKRTMQAISEGRARLVNKSIVYSILRVPTDVSTSGAIMTDMLRMPGKNTDEYMLMLHKYANELAQYYYKDGDIVMQRTRDGETTIAARALNKDIASVLISLSAYSSKRYYGEDFVGVYDARDYHLVRLNAYILNHVDKVEEVQGFTYEKMKEVEEYNFGIGRKIALVNNEKFKARIRCDAEKVDACKEEVNKLIDSLKKVEVTSIIVDKRLFEEAKKIIDKKTEIQSPEKRHNMAEIQSPDKRHNKE